MAPCFFNTAFSPRYMAAELMSSSRDTPSTREAVFSQRSATARASSLSAAARTRSLHHARLGRRGGEIERRAGRLGRFEALNRPEQVVLPRGGDESQVGTSFTQESRRVDEKPSAP